MASSCPVRLLRPVERAHGWLSTAGANGDGTGGMAGTTYYAIAADSPLAEAQQPLEAHAVTSTGLRRRALRSVGRRGLGVHAGGGWMAPWLPGAGAARLIIGASHPRRAWMQRLPGGGR